MPSIFETISADETVDYREYEDSLNFYDSEDEVLDVENNVTRGFLLSYGQNSGVIPVGTFVLVGYEDQNGVSVDELDAITGDGYVIFKQVDKVDGHIFIPHSANRISIPYKTYAYAFRVAGHNNYLLGLLSGDQGVTPRAVDDIKDVYSDSLVSKRSGADIKTLDLYGSKLEDAHAQYMTANNQELGSNYTIYPFELVLGMYMDTDLVNDNHIVEDRYGTIIR